MPAVVPNVPAAIAEAKAFIEGWYQGHPDPESRPRPPNLKRCKDIVPEWIPRTLAVNNNELEATQLSEDGCPSDRSAPPAVPNVLMPQLPTWDGQPIEVPRIPAASLTSTLFYDRYARAGMPVILTDLFPNMTWWAEHVGRVTKQALDDDRQQEAAAGGVDAKDCGIGWCRHGVHVASQQAEELALIDNANMPALLNRFHPHFDARPQRHDMPRPKVLWARAGATFGGPHHYDQGCFGTFTIQYTGLKRWTLWAPWDLPGEGRCGYTDSATDRHHGVAAHARYVAVLNATDTLYFPPAWFHHTEVLPGDISFSAAHFVFDAPVFGCLGRLSLWQSVFGFEACAAGPGGWREVGAALDTVLGLPPIPTYPGHRADGMSIVEALTQPTRRGRSRREPPRVEL